MNKISIDRRSLIIALFTITATHNFCMNDVNLGYVKEHKKYLRIEIEGRNDLRKEIKTLLTNDITKIGPIKPGPFDKFLYYTMPCLRFFSGLGLFGYCISSQSGGGSKEIALAAGVGLLGFVGATILFDKLTGSKFKEYQKNKIRKKTFEQIITWSILDNIRESPIE